MVLACVSHLHLKFGTHTWFRSYPHAKAQADARRICATSSANRPLLGSRPEHKRAWAAIICLRPFPFPYSLMGKASPGDGIPSGLHGLTARRAPRSEARPVAFTTPLEQ